MCKLWIAIKTVSNKNSHYDYHFSNNHYLENWTTINNLSTTAIRKQKIPVNSDIINCSTEI